MATNQEQKSHATRQVLVVDDDNGLRNLIIRALTKSGLSATGAANGAEAIAAVENNPDYLLLLDQRLPDMTGRDIISALDDRGCKVHFIIMTGQGDERLAVEMMKSGAADYLTKDTDFLDRLPGVLDRVFRNIETEKKLLEAEAEKKKLQNQLFQAQKMESVGRLAGGVAHDFNNMLGAIIGYTELALQKLPEYPIKEYLEQIHKAAERSADLTRQLLAFARKQTITPKVIELNETVKGMLKILQRLIGENIDLELLPNDQVLRVNIDPSQVDQLLANLVVNSRDAMVNGGKITIKMDLCVCSASCCSALGEANHGREYVTLTICDNGCGMNEETLSHLFEPFYTTKELGRGTGLGLATVYGIVQQNKGLIEVKSEPDKGTTFFIFLPHHQEQSASPTTLATIVNPASGSETILLVEDEPFVLRMTTMMLQNLGYQVIGAGNPKEALILAEKNPGEIDMLITDVIMPEMNGRDLARKVMEICPGIGLLYISGYTADIIAQQGIIEQGTHFLQKPFGRIDLSEKIRQVLGSRTNAQSDSELKISASLEGIRP